MTKPVYTWSIMGFQGEYRFLSNFWRCEFEIDGELYTSSEQAYMAQKCALPKDRAKIMSIDDPKIIKSIGSKVKLIDNWDVYRDKAMMKALIGKFSVPKMRGLLSQTRSAYIEETNHWNDTYWGVCNGEGKNMLGKMLMYLRDEHLNFNFEDCP